MELQCVSLFAVLSTAVVARCRGGCRLSVRSTRRAQCGSIRKTLYIIIIIIIIIFINCNWVVTRWQWLFDTYAKYEIGLLLNLRREGYMRSM